MKIPATSLSNNYFGKEIFNLKVSSSVYDIQTLIANRGDRSTNSFYNICICFSVFNHNSYLICLQ